MGDGATAQDDAEAHDGRKAQGGRIEIRDGEVQGIAVQQHRESLPDQPLRIDAQQQLGVTGRLFDRQILAVDDQQRAMWLNRARNVNRLEFTGGEICLTKDDGICG